MTTPLLPVQGEFGTCVFQDCIDFLRGQKDKAFDVSITDPPYNDDETVVRGNHYNKQRVIKVYPNKIPNYEQWCTEWFDEVKRVSSKIIFTCGRNNLEFWLKTYPKTFKIGIWLVPNFACRGYISKYINYDFILFYGDFGRQYDKETFVCKDNFIFEQYVNAGFLLTDFEKTLTHPHPKPLGLYELLILPLLPIRNILDIFMGSGTIGELGEKHRIKWDGVEKFDYREDIIKRILHGQEYRVKDVKEAKQQNFINLIKK